MIKDRRRSRIGRPTWPLILAFIAPGFALYCAIYLYPVLSALSYSLYDWQGVQRGAFIGVENFRRVLTLQPFAREIQAALSHNLWFFIGTLALQGILGFALALALERRVRGKRLVQTIVSTPYLMSSLVIGYIWSLILAPNWGPVNSLLSAVGLADWARPWLGMPDLILPLVIAINCWQWVGAAMLIFGAALTQIPMEQIEAARLDGAGYWRIVTRVQIPQIIGSVQVFTILIFIGAMNVFDLIYSLGGPSGGPAGAADVLGTLFYRISFSNSLNALGLSGAISVLIFVVTLVSTLLIVGVFGRLRARFE